MENLTPIFFENPATIFLIAAIVLIIFVIGIILDKDWAVFIIRKSGFTFYIASLGRKAVRIYQGIGFTIGAIAALFLFAYYSGYFNK